MVSPFTSPFTADAAQTGSTPLLKAVQYWRLHLSTLTLLLEGGADVDSFDNVGLCILRCFSLLLCHRNSSELKLWALFPDVLTMLDYYVLWCGMCVAREDELRSACWSTNIISTKITCVLP